MHLERSNAINNTMSRHPSIAPSLKLHLLHARGLLRSPRRQFQPRNQKKGQRKLKVHQPQKPYSPSDDSLDCCCALRDIYEVRGSLGKDGDSRLRWAVC